MTDQATIADQLAADGWTLERDCTDPGDYDKPSKWRVTLKRNRQEFTTTFEKGPAYRIDKRTKKRIQRPWNGRLTVHEREEIDRYSIPEPPTVDEVLCCLTSDAGSVRHGQTFEEFCGDMGYDEDSRKAERIFNACRDVWAGLTRLGADFDALETTFQDY